MVLRITPWLFAALACAACGDDAAPLGPPAGHTRQPIAGGDVDAETRAVHSLRVTTENGFRQCTATRIAPDLFVTARHCLVEGSASLPCGERFPDVLSPCAIELTNATQVDSPEAEAPVHRGSAVRVPEDDATCGADLALVITEEVAELEPALAPRLDPPPTRGEIYAAVGYGIVGVLAGGEGTRRRLDDREVECVGAACGNTVAEQEFLGGEGPCEGDSGGPALTQGEGDPEMLGVLSRGTVACERSVYTTLAAWSDFLREEARRAAHDAGYAAPAWTREPDDTPQGEVDSPAPDPEDPEAPPTEPPTDASASDPGGCSLTSPPARGGPLPVAVFVGLLAGWVRRRGKSELWPESYPRGPVLAGPNRHRGPR